MLHDALRRLRQPRYAALTALMIVIAGLCITAGTWQVMRFTASMRGEYTGGADTWQHLAYVVQWYVFAGLALAAPLTVSRYEQRAAQRHFLGIDPDADLDLDGDGVTSSTGAELSLRERGELTLQHPAVRAHVDRAIRMADRYGQQLSLPTGPVAPAHRHQRERPRDEYRSAYNDYLWQLAMAEGDTEAEPESGKS